MIQRNKIAFEAGLEGASDEKIRALQDVQRATFNILQDLYDEKARLLDTQQAILNILEDFNQEKRRLEETQKATVNILEDLGAEKNEFTEAQRAVLNILEDFNLEKNRLEVTQKATFNILDDFNLEKLRLEETQRAVLNILEDFNLEKNRLEVTQKATFNILEDFNLEKLRLEETQRAVLNVLEDFNLEKNRLEVTQKATFNILEDFNLEKLKLEETQRAVLNILEDFNLEKNRLEVTQKATFNILEDFNLEKLRLEETQRAVLNILEDFETEKTKVQEINSVLQQKTDELDRSNRELEHFAFIASHDLKEPLRMISSYLQLIALKYKGKFDKDADEFINFAVDGALRMDHMVNDLLEYSRVQTKARPFETVDSGALLKQAIENLGILIRESGAEVTCGDLPCVKVDPVQLARVFQNLIGNSIKFRRSEAPPKVHISSEDRNKEWVFSVRDNGIGIEPRDIERIFFLFQRVHGRKYHGTGIGLTICKRIVERHGGRIWVESDPGKGSTFFFSISKSIKNGIIAPGR